MPRQRVSLTIGVPQGQSATLPGGGTPTPTTAGDMIYSADGATWSRLGAGSNGTTAQIVGGVLSWVAAATARSNLSAQVVWTSTSYATAGGTQTVPSWTIAKYNTTGGVLTLNLPASPTDLDRVEFAEIGNSATALTVGRNGNNIDGAASNVTLSTAYAYSGFVFLSGFGWKRY